VVEFTSVVGGDNGIQLSSIKAADAPTPCAATAQRRRALCRETPAAARPGEAWVEPRLLAALGCRSATASMWA
jgi:putative ABC transport system permease protein